MGGLRVVGWGEASAATVAPVQRFGKPKSQPHQDMPTVRPPPDRISGIFAIGPTAGSTSTPSAAPISRFGSYADFRIRDSVTLEFGLCPGISPPFSALFAIASFTYRDTGCICTTRTYVKWTSGSPRRSDSAFRLVPILSHTWPSYINKPTLPVAETKYKHLNRLLQ
jgi:hypothetical protein